MTFNNQDKCQITDARIYTEEKNGNINFYLNVVYTYTDAVGIRKRTFPKVRLPFVEDRLPCLTYSSYRDRVPPVSVNFGFGALPLEENEDRVVIIDEIIERIPHKMTLEEIEKELGYKVELVSKKEEL